MATIVRKNTLKLKGLDPNYPILEFIPLENGNFMIYNQYDLHVFNSKGTLIRELKQNFGFEKIQKMENDTFLVRHQSTIHLWHIPIRGIDELFLSETMERDGTIQRSRVLTKLDTTTTNLASTRENDVVYEDREESIEIESFLSFNRSIKLFTTLRNGSHVLQLSDRTLLLLDKDLNIISENETPHLIYHQIIEQKQDGLVRFVFVSKLKNNKKIRFFYWDTKHNNISSSRDDAPYKFSLASWLPLNDDRILFFELDLGCRAILHVWDDENKKKIETNNSFQSAPILLETTWKRFGSRYFYSFSKSPRTLCLYDSTDYSKLFEFNFEEPITALLSDEENNRFITVDKQGNMQFYHVLERFFFHSFLPSFSGFIYLF